LKVIFHKSTTTKELTFLLEFLDFVKNVLGNDFYRLKGKSTKYSKNILVRQNIRFSLHKTGVIINENRIFVAREFFEYFVDLPSNVSSAVGWISRSETNCFALVMGMCKNNNWANFWLTNTDF
jgi:hypothetical protein